MNVRRYTMFPKTLEQCVEPVTRPLFKQQGLAGLQVLTQWQAIVGASLACHAVPEKLAFPRGKKTGGTLTVAVENGFATEMQMMQPVILERLAIYFGYQAVSRLVISPTPLPPPPMKTPTPRKRHLPDCSAMASEVDDEELRAALQSLAQTLAGK